MTESDPQLRLEKQLFERYGALLTAEDIAEVTSISERWLRRNAPIAPVSSGGGRGRKKLWNYQAIAAWIVGMNE